MSKLLFSALILVTVALLACNGEAPTQAHTETLTPDSTPTPHPTSTQVPTPTPGPTATPTPAPSPTATPTPATAPQQQVSRGESIAPLPLDNPEALKSELSQVELTCMGVSDNSQGLLPTLQALDMASQEEITELSLCLRDGTLLRLFLTEIIGQTGPLGGESSACIRAGFAGIDLRSAILVQVTGEDEEQSSTIFQMVISCLNEEEWAAAAPALGLSLNYREGMQCLTRELGGPEEAAAALQTSEQGPPFAFDLVAAAVACGLSESDLLALTATPPEVTPEDGVSVIAPLSMEDPAAFISKLSSTEQSCISTNVDPQQLAAMLSGSDAAPEGAEEVIQCFEDETLLRMFITGLISLDTPLSEETSSCIRGGLEGIDLRSMMSGAAEGNEQAAMVGSMSAFMLTLSCLNDEEWVAASAATGMDPGDREDLQCVMGQLGGPEGMAQALQSEDGNGVIDILTAALGCGLQLEMESGPGG